ncbi:probable cytochrome P450 4ac1 [Sitodiplosis mosellana]|uniref:probable cytochrome P450 4ac1 n=1 Tax=Sitodiplosis mosellana TaxID=263140 RepID=UPI002443981C|nr:probable cytochrome P450 4ac1 [Sitodiplosis mosellana]
MFYTLVMVLCSIVALLVLLDFLVKNFTTYKIAKLSQGPPMYPIIGSTQFLFSSQENTFKMGTSLCSKYPSGFMYWTFGIMVYHIYSADSFERIVTNPKHIEKSFTYKFLHQLLGTGLLTSTAEKWFARRKLLTPAFHFNILNGFQSTFNEQTEILLREIRKNEVNNPEGTHLQKLISRFTLNTICESAMGVKLTKIDELDDYRSKINAIGKYQVERMTVPWFLIDWLYNWFGNGSKENQLTDQAHAFTGGVIATKRKAFLANQKQQNATEGEENDSYTKRRHAMLDTLLMAELNQKIDRAGIQEEVDTFVFEGFDTTMTAITFILLAIANHEDVQQKLYEEIKAHEGEPNYNNLTYMDAVIKEALRLYPAVPFIGRILGEDTVIDNVKLPAKTIIHIIIHVLHRDPANFPDPEKFQPNRFLNNEVRHPFAYVPFSAGQRNCIGQKFAMMELRTVVGEIVKNFELKPITKTEDVVIISDLILRARDPIRVKFVARSQN